MEQQLSAPERVRAALESAGISVEVRSFDASTRTAQDAANAIGTTVGQIVKSLVFISGDHPVLALVSGSNQVDLGRLGALTDGTIRKADAAAVRQATGYAIGGVPPFGFPSPLPTFIDRDLLQFADVWAAAGTPNHVFKATPTELVRITGGAVVDLKSA